MKAKTRRRFSGQSHDVIYGIAISTGINMHDATIIAHFRQNLYRPDFSCEARVHPSVHFQFTSALIWRDMNYQAEKMNHLI
jgi:hypothetical protein